MSTKMKVRFLFFAKTSVCSPPHPGKGAISPERRPLFRRLRFLRLKSVKHRPTWARFVRFPALIFVLPISYPNYDPFRKNMLFYLFFVPVLCSFCHFFKNQQCAQFVFPHFYLNAKKALICPFSVDKWACRWYPIYSYKHYYASRLSWILTPYAMCNGGQCNDKE